MAAQLLRRWESVINLLSSVAQADHPDPKRLENALAAVEDFEEQLSAQPSVPRAVWKKLLQQKVPLRLGLACRQLLLQPHQQCIYQQSLVTYAAVALLRQADKAGMKDSTGSLANGLQQQLQRSGLPEQLPALTSATAQRLQEAVTAGTAYDPLTAAAAESADPSLGLQDAALGKLALNLLKVMLLIEHIIPDSKDSCMLPAAHLTVACMQYISAAAALEPMPTWTCMLPHLAELASRLAAQCVEYVQWAVCNRSKSAEAKRVAEQALRSSHFLQCLCMQLAVQLTASALVQAPGQQQLLQQLSSFAANCSLRSQSSELASVMPTAVAKLVQQLGCSKEVMLLALPQSYGKQQTAESCDERIIFALVAYYYLFHTMDDGVALDHTLWQAWSTPEQEQQKECQALLLAAILQWAASIAAPATGGAGTRYIKYCSIACEATVHALLFYDELSVWLQQTTSTRDQLQQQQQQAQQQQPGVRALVNCSAPVQLPEEAVQDTPQLVGQMLSRLLEIYRSSLQGCPADLGSSSSGAGSDARAPTASSSRATSSISRQDSATRKGSSAGDLSCLREAVDAAGVLVLQLAAQPLTRDAHRSNTASSSHTDAARQSRAADACTAGQLSSQMENVVRAVTADWKQHCNAWGPSCSFSPRTLKMLIDFISIKPPLQGWLGMLVVPIASAAAGSPTNAEALQLFGLLCSMLKLSNLAAPPASDFAREAIGMHYCMNVGDAACYMLDTASRGLINSHSPTSATGSDSTMAVTALLPWLVLLGRCYLLMAYYLQQLGVLLRQGDKKQVVQQHWHLSILFVGDSITESVPALRRLCSKYAGQLAALGCNTQQLLDSMHNLEVAYVMNQAATASAAGALFPAALVSLALQLQAVGQVLSSFPIPHACNNPECSNVSGPAEAQLVGGRSCICAGCRQARYCGRQCQKLHWPQHKPVCKALAAAGSSLSAQ